MKDTIHYYKKPLCELRTLCGQWLSNYRIEYFYHGKLRKCHTIYKNRVTCKECLDEIKKQKI